MVAINYFFCRPRRTIRTGRKSAQPAQGRATSERTPNPGNQTQDPPRGAHPPHQGGPRAGRTGSEQNEPAGRVRRGRRLVTRSQHGFLKTIKCLRGRHDITIARLAWRRQERVYPLLRQLPRTERHETKKDGDLPSRRSEAKFILTTYPKKKSQSVQNKNKAAGV